MMPCELIAKQIGGLFKCSAADSYTTIQTPYLFPDGDIIELFFRETSTAGALLTDFGETLRWLDGQTAARHRTKRHLKLIQDVCSSQRVEFNQGEVSVKVSAPEMMADAITRLAQATIRIADLSFTFRTTVFQSFDDEVEEFLWEHQINFERRFEIKGASGTDWLVDFRTRANKTGLLFTLSSGSRAAANRRTDHVVAAFDDLKHLRDQFQFVSLVDDTIDVWISEDFKRLEPHCRIANWSKPDELLYELQAAA